MKKLFFLFFVLMSIGLLSCDESFNPFTEFKPNYGVACILRSDTTLQLLSVTNNYPNGSDVGTIPKFLFEPGADVRVWYQDSVYRFRDTSIIFAEGTDTIKYYYSNNFKIDYSKDIELEVLLTTGKRLKAFNKTPEEILFKNTSEVLLPPVSKNIVQFFWSVPSLQYYFLPRLRVKCERLNNGFKEIFYKELPLRYETIDGIEQPVFPKPGKSQSIAYQMNAINKFLSDYSASLANPSSVSIHQILDFEVITFDAEVSRYISVSNSSTNSLSIRFDEGDYSNINGALGIFGSQVNKKYTRLKVLENHIRSFNFNYIYDL
ncbi:MAG TPA: DUF4249 family protein [Ignavibacteriaceae bacterium]|nr:DUF4249 family protein [Ignavibacteriaceae bacterium]